MLSVSPSDTRTLYQRVWRHNDTVTRHGSVDRGGGRAPDVPAILVKLQFDTGSRFGPSPRFVRNKLL